MVVAAAGGGWLKQAVLRAWTWPRARIVGTMPAQQHPWAQAVLAASPLEWQHGAALPLCQQLSLAALVASAKRKKRAPADHAMALLQLVLPHHLVAARVVLSPQARPQLLVAVHHVLALHCSRGLLPLFLTHWHCQLPRLPLHLPLPLPLHLHLHLHHYLLVRLRGFENRLSWVT